MAMGHDGDAFAKLEALLREAAARTVEQLWRVIGEYLDAFTPTECANYFANCGYDADRSKNALGAIVSQDRKCGRISASVG